MGRRIVDECVDCGLPCLGSRCPHRNVIRFYCDECEDEDTDLYKFDGKELCLDCLLKKFETVDIDNYD